MLKVDLHMHCKSDPQDKWIKYTAKDLIKKAKEVGLDVIAITPHNKLFNDQESINYAKEKGIILIPGIEKEINKRHTLILNANKEIEEIHTFKQLKEYKSKHPEILIIAPHPFYKTKNCHGHNITRYKDLFDAWEFSYFYTNEINPNRKLERLAKIYQKPVVGNSDTHILKNLGRTHSIVHAKKDTRNIIDSIKAGRVELVTHPLTRFEFISSTLKMIFRVRSH